MMVGPCSDVDTAINCSFVSVFCRDVIFLIVVYGSVAYVNFGSTLRDRSDDPLHHKFGHILLLTLVLSCSW